MQDVLAVSIPLKDDSAVKEYLLYPRCRAGFILSHGAVASRVQGAQSIEPLLGSRSFVCLHYKVGAHGALQPSNADDVVSDTGVQPTNLAGYDLLGSPTKEGIDSYIQWQVMLCMLQRSADEIVTSSKLH